MKLLTIYIICNFLMNTVHGQDYFNELKFGKYEGKQSIFVTIKGDTSIFGNQINETFGKKILKINKDSSFLIEFLDRYPRASSVQTRRTTGKWKKNKDTLILNSTYLFRDFAKVEESKIESIDTNLVRIKIGMDLMTYYPNYLIQINDQKINSMNNPWTYFYSKNVQNILINRFSGARDMEWQIKPKNITSNCFVINLLDEIDSNNFVVENYKLLITDSSLIQIDKLFKLNENVFKLSNSR